jgi:hypothetical protein
MPPSGAAGESPPERAAGRTKPSTLACSERVALTAGVAVYQAQHSPRKYTEAYVDWLLSKYAEDPNFFKQARELIRMTNLGSTRKE